MANNTSQHILGTAANLLGFCLFVITSVHTSNTAATTLIDDFTSIIALLLSLSCLFSFISIRDQSPARSDRFEAIADYLFFSSLTGILLIVILLVFKFVK